MSDLGYDSLLKIAQLLEFNKTTLNLIKLPIWVVPIVNDWLIIKSTVIYWFNS